MRRVLTVAVAFCLLCASAAYCQGVGNGMKALFGGVKVNPYVQIGRQSVGSNMSLPIEAERVLPTIGDLQIAGMDISLQGADFWTGAAGINIKTSEMLSFFVTTGGILNRPFVVSGEIPVSVGLLGTSAKVDFTASNVEGWYIQTGAGLGPILLGLYWDHFALDIGNPIRASGEPLPNQTLRGYVLTKTFCPFIGLAIPASDLLATVLYSPWALSNTKLALRSSQSTLSELSYKWNKPGNFLSASLQYNMPLSKSASFALWGNYTWMTVRGAASLEFENTDPPVTRQKDVTATMTKYVLSWGVTLSVNF